MKTLAALIVIINLFACTGTVPSGVSQSEPAAKAPGAKSESNTPESAKPVKSLHEYIITKDYQPGRFE